jgi:DNA invertase Pin-like site-specific DNA recombinase
MAAPLAGYVRVSHVGGRTGDRFHSPTEQIDEIAAWARRSKHIVEMLAPELDAKGSDATRPTLRKAVDGIRDGTYSGVVVAYLSRAGRDLRLMLDLWDEVEHAGGAVHFARENIDASTPSGRLHRNIMASIAQHELEERRAGFDRSRAATVQRGIWKQRQTPRGYSRDPDTRKLIPNEQAGEVRQAFADRAGGRGISPIAQRLSMTTSGVRAMLRNRVYLGELREGAYVNAAAHEPLVTVELFEAAQRAVSRPARATRSGPALLAGLVRCAGCGHVMSRGGHSDVVVYGCARNHSGQRCPEPAAVMLTKLDAYVTPIALAELGRVVVQEAEGAGAEPARATLARAESDLTAYLEAISPTDVGVEAFAAGARAKREAVDAARDELRQHLTVRSVVLPDSTDAAALWETLDAQQRNTLLRSLLAAVVVRRAGGRGARVPLNDRIRVLAHGTELALPPRSAGAASGIVPIPLADLDHEHVAGILRA